MVNRFRIGIKHITTIYTCTTHPPRESILSRFSQLANCCTIKCGCIGLMLFCYISWVQYNKYDILTTNLAAVVCVDVCQCATFDQFLPARSHFESKRSENFVRIAKFPYAAFGPLFAFHCPLFFTRNNDL